MQIDLGVCHLAPVYPRTIKFKGHLIENSVTFLTENSWIDELILLYVDRKKHSA